MGSVLRLRLLSTAFGVERHERVPAGDWFAVVRAPEGVTVVREAGPRTGAADRWVGVYDADAGHGLDVPGLLASVVAPLAGAGVPVFVVSTYDADLVLVPEARKGDMVVALEGAGHELMQPAMAWTAAPVGS